MTTTAYADVAGTTRQLSTGDASHRQRGPSISESYVAWTETTLASGGSTDDVMLMPLNGGAVRNLTSTPRKREYQVDLDGGTVLYTTFSPFSSGDVVALDVSPADELPQTLAMGNAIWRSAFTEPAISGDLVVFLWSQGGQSDVAAYDYANGWGLGKITSDQWQQERPRVSGRTVVWEDYRNWGNYPDGNSEVYGATLTGNSKFTVFPLAVGVGYHLWPDIENGKVVYVGGATKIDGTGGDLYLIDLNDPQHPPAKRLTNTPSHKQQPRISGNRVVFADDRSGDFDVRVVDLQTLSDDLLAGGPGNQLSPDIEGDNVVYTSDASGFEQVYLFTIAH